MADHGARQGDHRRGTGSMLTVESGIRSVHGA